MNITSFDNIVVSIPLKQPVKISHNTYTTREFNILLIHTNEGVTGVSYARGGAIVHAAIEELGQLLIGEDPMMKESLWQKMYHSHLLQGRKGAVLRAISAIDIALWDITGKLLQQPVGRLLGGYRTEVPCYVSFSGYYLDHDLKRLAEETEDLLKRGFNAFKLRVGARSIYEDVERVKLVRSIVGDSHSIMVDANNSYNDPTLAIRAGRQFEALNVLFMEEPTMPDNMDGSAQIAQALDMAIATGEQECTRWGFKEIIEKKSADILQPDVTVVGGISEWMKISSMASAWHLPIMPHYFFDISIHCAAASVATTCMEYFPSDSPVISFDRMLEQPLTAINSTLKMPEEPGIGLRLNMREVAALRVK